MTRDWNLCSIPKAILLKIQCLTVLVALMLPLGVYAHHLKVDEPILQMPLPGQTMGVGYFELKNTAGEPVTLIEVSHPEWRIEMHKSVMDNGRMRMMSVESVQVPAAGSVEFYQGGLHLMVMGWTPDDRASTPLRFTMSDGSVFYVPFTITRW